MAAATGHPELMTGLYNSWIVALSVLVAIAISYAALSLSARVVRSRGLVARLWLWTGAFTMGVGIWAMHFIGMMAFSLPIALGYDIPITLLSLGFAIAASAYALFIVTAPSITRRRLGGSAAIFGAGICAMHYTGMAAITIVPGIRYDAAGVLASVAVALLASLTGFYLVFKLREGGAWRRQLARAGGACAMGLAISLMHYTGMAAARFDGKAFCQGGLFLDQSWLALAVAGVALALIAILSVVLVVDAQMASHLHRYAMELELANARLHHSATHDGLTGLPNRTHLTERLAQIIGDTRRKGYRAAVLVIDLDRFKAINDSLGHLAGDEMLREVARRVQALIRSTDMLARLGGDEFVLVLDALQDLTFVESVTARLHAEIARPLDLGGIELQVSSSIGIALCPDDGTDCTTLLRNADAAMYYGKKSSRNGWNYYTRQMGDFSRDRLELESGLRRAIENEEFFVLYQPKIDLRTGRVEGAEALIRWRHPTRGVVSPTTFIQIAEESGAILAIGTWMLHEACRQLRHWQDCGHVGLRMAVNLSAIQLQQANIVSSVQGALQAAGIAPGSLELELTESAVMRDTERSAQVLRQLVALGVSISVDDFGTGYSSLSYLRRLPLHRLKIDRCFVRELTHNDEDAEIVRAIVSLAHSLNLLVTAEGVETPQQLARLRELGCDEYQGFHFSTPVTADEFLALLGVPTPTARRLRILGNTASTRQNAA